MVNDVETSPLRVCVVVRPCSSASSDKVSTTVVEDTGNSR